MNQTQSPVEGKNPLTTAEFFIDIKQFEKAKIVLDLLKPYASTIDDFDQLGKLYADIREFNDSLEIALKMYSMTTVETLLRELRTNIIRAYLNLNKPYDALRYIDIQNRMYPDDQPNRMDRAMALFLLNRKNEGEAILRQILTEPHDDDIDFRIKFNLAF